MGQQDSNTEGLLRRAVQEGFLEELPVQVIRDSSLQGPSLLQCLLVVMQDGQVQFLCLQAWGSLWTLPVAGRISRKRAVATRSSLGSTQRRRGNSRGNGGAERASRGREAGRQGGCPFLGPRCAHSPHNTHTHECWASGLWRSKALGWGLAPGTPWRPGAASFTSVFLDIWLPAPGSQCASWKWGQPRLGLPGKAWGRPGEHPPSRSLGVCAGSQALHEPHLHFLAGASRVTAGDRAQRGGATCPEPRSWKVQSWHPSPGVSEPRKPRSLPLTPAREGRKLKHPGEPGWGVPETVGLFTSLWGTPLFPSDPKIPSGGLALTGFAKGCPPTQPPQQTQAPRPRLRSTTRFASGEPCF
ncbi:uncharacterized protein AAES06_022852 isoform 1-T5 [Glossophaga mutica]